MNTQTLNQTQLNETQTAGFDLTTLKITALQYLKEVSEKEDYEKMGEIVKYAREFGAKDYEILISTMSAFDPEYIKGEYRR